MSFWEDLSFQDAGSPLMEQLIYFNDYILVILILTTGVVAFLMVSLPFNKLSNRLMLDNQPLEFIWTLTPALILIFVAFPSLRLLYLLDEESFPKITLKITGFQWFWVYEYSDFLNVKFKSYITPTSKLELANSRLLDVDNRIVLPMFSDIRVLMTAKDVIHSWTVPALGVKADAIPGRINQVNFLMTRPGLFFGQCSEICGANHSFMPIVVESTSFNYFLNWVHSFDN